MICKSYESKKVKTSYNLEWTEYYDKIKLLSLLKSIRSEIQKMSLAQLDTSKDHVGTYLTQRMHHVVFVVVSMSGRHVQPHVTSTFFRSKIIVNLTEFIQKSINNY